MKYAAFLRGINVSGVNRIKMDNLIDLMESLGFDNCQSYLQSGNVVFSTDGKDTHLLETLVENQLKTKMGLDITVIIRTQHQLQSIISQNPYAANPTYDEMYFHITLLKEASGTTPLVLDNSPAEAYATIDDSIYLYCPEGYGRTKMNNQTIERKLKVKATTRNWRTIVAVNKMMN